MNRSTLVGALVALLLVSSAPPLPAQYVYFSEGPNDCVLNEPTTTYRIFAYSPDDADFDGASFALDVEFYTPGDLVSVTPESGVTIEAMDVSAYPMTFTLSWAPDALDHRPLIVLQYADYAYTGGWATVSDVVMRRPSSAENAGSGLAVLLAIVHCSCEIRFDLPAVAEVAVGETTVVPFQWLGYCWGAWGGALTVTDEHGWVQAWTPATVGAVSNCTLCFLDWYGGTVTVGVPAETPVGTESEVTLEAFNNDTGTFRVRAVAPNPVEATSWGAVKALFAVEE
jgi:hypothetical protein